MRLPQRRARSGLGKRASPVAGTGQLGPDFTAGLWTSWIEWAAWPYLGASAANRNWWQVLLDGSASDPLQGGVGQLFEALSKDPILRAAEDTLNANPLRQIIPWTGPRSSARCEPPGLQLISRPEQAIASTIEFNLRAWQSVSGYGTRPVALVRTGAFAPAARGGEDKRFAAPEWQHNPAYRTLKELYLLASEWLLGWRPKSSPDSCRTAMA